MAENKTTAGENGAAVREAIANGDMPKPPRYTDDAPGDGFRFPAGIDLDAISEAQRDALFRMRGRFLNSPYPADVRGDPKKEREHALSYPKPFKKNAGTAEETLVRNWKQQKRTKCGDPRCYYVLEPKRFSDVNSGNPLVLPTVDGGEGIAAECAWDPRHVGGLQFIPVERQDDEA